MRLSVRVALTPPYTFLAQLVEQRSFKPQVAGSSPAGRTICVLSSVGRSAACYPHVTGSSPVERAICAFSSAGSAGFLIRRSWVRSPQGAPYARMAELEYAPD